MYKFIINLLLILSILLFIGCSSFNQSLNTNIVLAKVSQLMNTPIPLTSPNIWVVDSPGNLADICTKVDKNSLRNLKNGNIPVGACIAGDIFLLRNALSESTLAHEMAHYIGADEQEAERVATNFSHTLIFRPRSTNGDWGRFAINR